MTSREVNYTWAARLMSMRQRLKSHTHQFCHYQATVQLMCSHFLSSLHSQHTVSWRMHRGGFLKKKKKEEHNPTGRDQIKNTTWTTLLKRVWILLSCDSVSCSYSPAGELRWNMPLFIKLVMSYLRPWTESEQSRIEWDSFHFTHYSAVSHP